MHKQVGTINVAPEPEAYARMLIEILRNSENPDDIQFATDEVVKWFKVAGKAAGLESHHREGCRNTGQPDNAGHVCNGPTVDGIEVQTFRTDDGARVRPGRRG
jgi:hypothetical protein